MKFLMSIFIPPVGVAMKGGSGTSIIINIVLCACGYIPGIIHALIVSDKSKVGSTVVINNIINERKD